MQPSPPPPARTSRSFFGTLLGGIVLLVAAFLTGRFTAAPGNPTQGATETGGPARARSKPAGQVAANSSAASNAELVSDSSSGAQSEERWRERARRPANPARDRELAAALEQLAVASPQRALALAQAETNLRLRELLLRATLRGWASSEPDAAVGWALSQDERRRADAVAAALQGLARRSDDAVRLGKYICAQDPARAIEHGSAVVVALTESGAFADAARFAQDGAPEHRVVWLADAFGRWASYEPKSAVESALALTDPDSRDEAFRAAAGGWAQTDPAALTHYVVTLSPGPARAEALSVALRQWVDADPIAALDWFGTVDSAPELDDGAAAVATLSTLITRQPAVAVSWGESIVDPEKKSETLLEVVREWASVDPAAARRYAEQTPHLQTDDRTRALEELQPAAAN